MRFEVFGYYIYPAFIAAIILIPLAIFATIFLVRYLRERRQVYSTSVITKWEKKYLPRLLEEEKEKTTDEDYAKTIDELIDYINECDYWNTDELLEIHKDAIIILTEIIFDDIKEKHRTNPDRCVLLIHAIDNINGGIEYERGSNWMAEDMTTLKNHEKMGEDEAKLLALCESVLERIMDNFVDTTSNKVMIYFDVFEELVDVTREDLASAIRDVTHCIDFTALQEETYNLIECCLIDYIDKTMKKQNQDYLDDFYQSYFRALASVIDRQLYSDILKTIED